MSHLKNDQYVRNIPSVDGVPKSFMEVLSKDGGPVGPLSLDGSQIGRIYTGMTLYEHYAGLALQGILANPNISPTFSKAVEDARRYARVLVDQLRAEEHERVPEGTTRLETPDAG